MSSVLFHNQFHCFSPQVSRHNFRFAPAKSLRFSSANARQNFRREAASLGGSGAEYSEQLMGSEKKRKKKSIAGIDQDELLDPASLADPDSCFCEFEGVQIHHKIYHEEEQKENSLQNEGLSQLSSQSKPIGLPMILLHGFGASLYSWSRSLKPLARVAGSKVVAFDRPAFGLTSRLSRSAYEDTKSLNPYSMAFSVLATLHFINYVAVDKAILLGHSAGSLVAVNAYFEARERVAALILIAPAIVAPLVSQKPAKEKHNSEGSSSNSLWNIFTKIKTILSKISTSIARAIMKVIKGIANMFRSLYKRALTAFLRSAFAAMLVRMVIDKFGVAGIKNAWYDPTQVTDHVLDGYTKPLRTKDWDRALLEFVVTMLTDSPSESKPPVERRVSEISCPVIIITGDCDRLVPSWNAERLSKAIPGACFEVIKNCGHLPHEEKVEEFVSIVQKFLQKVTATPDEQILQAAAP